MVNIDLDEIAHTIVQDAKTDLIKSLKKASKNLLGDMQSNLEDNLEDLKHNEFNAGWGEFKQLVLMYIKDQFGEESEIGKLLLDDIENLC
tara:strand:+ start:288 stop:557 length:270 start_codon:yes stop_codon:yes gene_type:complete